MTEPNQWVLTIIADGEVIPGDPPPHPPPQPAGDGDNEPEGDR